MTFCFLCHFATFSERWFYRPGGAEWQAYWMTRLGIPVTTQQVKAGLGHRNGSGGVYCYVMLLSRYHYLPFLPATGWRAYLTSFVLLKLTLACGTSLTPSSYFPHVSYPESPFAVINQAKEYLSRVRNNDTRSTH